MRSNNLSLYSCGFCAVVTVVTTFKRYIMEKIDIESLKERYKADKLRAITWDTLSQNHLETARSLAKEGMNFRLQSREITEAEDALNRIRLACLKGGAALDDFRAVNEKWSGAIKAVNEKSKKTTLF